MSNPFSNTATNFQAGNICHFVHEWASLSGDPWVRETVVGARIPLEREPTQVRVPYPYKLKGEEPEFMDQEVGKLLRKGVIEQVDPEQGQFVSNVFLRPKQNGDFRMILDLTELNKCVVYEHFKMTSLQTAVDMLRPGAWMGSVDLKDAYYSVPVCPEQRKLLRFIWRGSLYQFVGLPNGLACAPRIFTKLLNPIFADLRMKGVECFPYIDDSFVIADTQERCKWALRELSLTLDRLGLVVHEDKSVLTPTQVLTFLGFSLDSVNMRVEITPEKVQKFTRAGQDLLGKVRPTVREVAGVIGLMTAYSPAVSYGGAHIKWLEWDKNKALGALAGDFEGTVSLSERAKEDIAWWLQNLTKPRQVRLDKPTVVIYTDASMEGWGAHRGDVEIGGRWTPSEAQDHINVLELRAILFGLKSLCLERDLHIKVFSDNTTAIAYVRKMGGVRSEGCNEVARQIWIWAEEQGCWLTIAHIPGQFNTVADFKSRNFTDNLEWEISDKIFAKVCKIFGKPDVDMFASRLNKKLSMYVSWHPDPGARDIDAFAVTWTDDFVYLFPPFSLVGRALQKVVADGARAVLIAPEWPGQPWYARLQYLTQRKLKFRKRRGNLKNAGKPENKELLDSCPLGAYLLWPQSCEG